MKKNTYSGLFIAFEGLDGSGASIQASLLSGILSKEGYRVHLTKEPTNYLTGGLIRSYLTHEWQSSPTCLQLLFAADRAQHIEQAVVPKLSSGQIVITDRYAMSSAAYGAVNIDDIDWIEGVNNQFILPDLTFLISIRPQICALRLKESNYEFELFKEEEKLAKVWKNYQELAKRYKNVHLIDGERDEIDIIKDIVEITKKALGVAKKSQKK